MLEKYKLWMRRTHINSRVEIISEKGEKWGKRRIQRELLLYLFLKYKEKDLKQTWINLNTFKNGTVLDYSIISAFLCV